MATAPRIGNAPVADPRGSIGAPRNADRLGVLVLGGEDGLAHALLDRLRDATAASPASEPLAQNPKGTTPSQAGSTARLSVRAGQREVELTQISSEADLALDIVSGSLTSRAALVVIDASVGIRPRDCTTAAILGAIGIHDVILAVELAHPIEDQRTAYDQIVNEYRLLAGRLQVARVAAVPISAATGEGIALRGPSTSRFGGTTILALLDSIAPGADEPERGLRIVVEEATKEGGAATFAGTTLSGTAAPGDRILILPSGIAATIGSIAPRNAPEASPGSLPVTVSLLEEVEIACGSVIAALNHRPEVADQFAADIVWLHAQPLLKGRPYRIELGPQSAIAQVTDIRYVVNAHTAEHAAGRVVERNGVARCHLSLSTQAVMEPYGVTPALGAFLLIDRASRSTVGAGRIVHALRRAHNIHWQAIDVTAAQRASIKGQRACCIWFTGLSGSGKSTISNLLEKRLHALGHHTYVLDGDNVRHGLNRDLGFTEADRVENIRRVAEVARLMVDAGLITIVSFISPFRAERRLARERFESGSFIEAYVDAPLDVCELRDPKGLYRKARAGLIQNFTGITSPYEPPDAPDLHLTTSAVSPEAVVDQILKDLHLRGIVSAS